MFDNVFIVTEDSYSDINEIVTVVLGVYTTKEIAIKNIKEYCNAKGYEIIDISDDEIDYKYQPNKDFYDVWNYEYHIKQLPLISE